MNLRALTFVAVAFWYPTDLIAASPFAVTRETCFERTYDEAHLAAHAGQKVRRIRLTARPDEEGQVAVGLDVWLRNRTERYAAYAFCRAEKGTTTCRSEFDERIWKIRWQAADAVLIENGSIWLNPWAYDAEDRSDRGVRLNALPDDRAWRLKASACPTNPNS